jgi:DNA repair exonuclease SbcCD ATPase subunit
MILKKLKIQNFRSFGNNINELEFDTDKGNLILLVGENGNGKTSLIFSLDYALYGEVKNNNKKIKLSSLPNRFNKNMMVELDFISNKNNINILRKLNPVEFTVKIDGEDIKRLGKNNIQDKLEECLEFDMDSWKSFISMSINDFKNFMSLNPEEKRMLLDRLFNLEMINNIFKFLKEKKKQFKYEIDLYDAEINSYQSSLNEFKISINKLKESAKNNLEFEKNELKKSMLSKKDDFSKLEEKLNKCSEKKEELKKKYSDIRELSIDVDFQIANTKEKIILFNSGICPMCGNNLSSETYNAYRDELNQKLFGLEEVKKQLTTEYTEVSNKLNKLSIITNETKNIFNELKKFLEKTKRKNTIIGK